MIRLARRRNKNGNACVRGSPSLTAVDVGCVGGSSSSSGGGGGGGGCTSGRRARGRRVWSFRWREVEVEVEVEDGEKANEQIRLDEQAFYERAAH
ncbi:hypothetical protein ACCO45_001032 [Purpureocillium lilacinum]|uniref:Uncharacterized protein n=1 Tax=Purpureocillium lilacinum TaxID=33203 RepID=A0ACC4E944_PURLI